MPMPISNLDEYDKVVNVSWYTPEKPRQELAYVSLRIFDLKINIVQVSLCIAVFTDVSALLHRHPQFPQPVLFLFG
jgi:hypothetical protein